MASVFALSGCGGGSADSVSPAPARVDAPATEPALTLAPPRVDRLGNRIALAWSSGAFTGSVFARIELGLSFFPSQGWTLQNDGAAVVHQLRAPFPTPGSPERPARFELRYAGGFFVLTALDDNDIASNLTAFGVDVYPAGVTPVPPSIPCDLGVTPCYNGLGFFSWQLWPKRAGESFALPIPRDDPARLIYSVLLKPSEHEPFATVATDIAGLTAVVERGAAWKLDFPTARVKVRGCDAGNRCIESAEQPLQAALLDGVGRIELRQSTDPHVALSANGAFIAVRDEFQGPSIGTRNVFVYQRAQHGNWLAGTVARSDTPGFGRTFALSGDGDTLAVEASTCAAGSDVCAASAVLVFHRESGMWVERARIEGAREPRVSHDGSRLAAIGLTGARPARLRVFARSGQAWNEEVFPQVDLAPLDVELSGDGRTLAAVRQGTVANPCGCRAVVVFTSPAIGDWRQSAELRSFRHAAGGSADDDGFGFGGAGSDSLGIDTNGTTIAVGASLDNSDASDATGDAGNRGAPRSGAIHVFGLDNGTWRRRAFLKARAAAGQDFLGRYVALSGDGRVVVGGARGLAANQPGVNRNHAAGRSAVAVPGAEPLEGAAAHVFEQQSSGAWTERASAIPPTPGRVPFDTGFRLALSADGATMVLNALDRRLADDPLDPGGGVLTAFVY